MRALALSAFVIGAAAVAGCRADYPPQSASIPQETAPATPALPDQIVPAASLSIGPAEATGPPTNILERPRSNLGFGEQRQAVPAFQDTTAMSTHLLPERLSFLNPHILDDLARYGNSHDGGYVLPRSIAANIDAVLSCGLSTDWSLEKELAAGNPERVIHVYDHTVSARGFRRSLKNAFWKFVVGRTSLADLRRRYRTVTDYNEFFTGNHVHFRERIFNRQDHANDATLATAFARLHAASRILVKIDIEGDEYRVIPELARFADRIDLIAIEFHNTEPFREVFEA